MVTSETTCSKSWRRTAEVESPSTNMRVQSRRPIGIPRQRDPAILEEAQSGKNRTRRLCRPPMASQDSSRMLPFRWAHGAPEKNLLRPFARFNRQSVEMTKRNNKQLSLFLRCASIGCIIAVALLSWLPATIMMRTVLGGHAEHFIAYMGTSILTGLAFQRGPRPTTQGVLLIMYAAVLEVGQLYSPGRHASLEDFAFSAAGVVIGGLFLSIARPRVLSWLRRD